MTRFPPIALLAWLLAATSAQAQDPNADPRLPATPADQALYRAFGKALEALLPPDDQKFRIVLADRRDPVFLIDASPGFEQIHCERTATFGVVLAQQSDPVGAVSASLCADSRHVQELADHEAATLPKALARLPELTAAVRAQWHLSADARRLPDGSTFSFTPVMMIGHGLFHGFHGVLLDPTGGPAVVVQLSQMQLCDGGWGREALKDKPLCTDPRAALQSIATALGTSR